MLATRVPGKASGTRTQFISTLATNELAAISMLELERHARSGMPMVS